MKMSEAVPPLCYWTGFSCLSHPVLYLSSCLPHPVLNLLSCLPHPVLNLLSCLPHPVLTLASCLPFPVLNLLSCLPHPVLNLLSCLPYPVLNLLSCLPHPVLTISSCLPYPVQTSLFRPRSAQFFIQSTYRGGGEIGGVYLLCWRAYYNLVRDSRYRERGWACTSHSHQPGLTLPS
jgi:hypothetical protein